MVLVNHGGSSLITLTDPPSVLGHVLNLLGSGGVNLFFSLSGFLIGQILIRLVATGVNARSIGSFWMRRWLRTLPLYYSVILYLCYYTDYVDVYSLLFLQNFQHENMRNVLNITWSLVLEEYFYFFFPLLLIPLAKLTSLRPITVVATLSALLIVICTSVRLGINYSGLHVADNSFRDQPFLRLDCAAWGVLAACARLGLPAHSLRWFRVPGLVPSISILLTVLQMWLFIMTYNAKFVTVMHYNDWYFVYQSTVYSVSSAVFAALVLALSLQLPLIGGVGGWLVRFISLRSYSIYLLHIPVMVFIVPNMLGELAPWNRLLASIVVVLLLSSATYVLIERPFLWMRGGFERKSKRAATS